MTEAGAPAGRPDFRPAATFAEAACRVLNESDPARKAQVSRHEAARFRAGRLDLVYDPGPPDRPERPTRPELLPPSKMPKRGRAGSSRSRIALLHALAHIELNAIDLAWDAALRFGADMPPSFTSDWISVGDDEARHFLMLADRLEELGATYGDLPAHDGLWQAAVDTSHDLAARLAVVPQVLEARGLDVSPATVERLRAAGDEASARIVDRIYRDEIGHVSIGNRWFRFLCESTGDSPPERFRVLVQRHFKGRVKPPFNDSARQKAGLTTEYYSDLD
ncbi:MULTISPECIES: ferritin-like domain-containing protein [Pacificimonas]|uniref:ferritin-like domain-containing protein n=1 Tax=Pacificimonas TaxID=1960290 RepID=UPI0037C520A7